MPIQAQYIDFDRELEAHWAWNDPAFFDDEEEDEDDESDTEEDKVER